MLQLRFVFFHLQGIFLFSLIWSVGASCRDDGRLKFDIILREMLNGSLSEETNKQYKLLTKLEQSSKAFTVPFPKEATIYDYRFVKKVRIAKYNVGFQFVVVNESYKVCVITADLFLLPTSFITE